VKWWWLRAFRPAHPAIADRTAWQQVVRRAAGLDG
jgi:hypothetical protein